MDIFRVVSFHMQMKQPSMYQRTSFKAAFSFKRTVRLTSLAKVEYYSKVIPY